MEKEFVSKAKLIEMNIHWLLDSNEEIDATLHSSLANFVN